jgi:amino acid transporter
MATVQQRPEQALASAAGRPQRRASVSQVTAGGAATAATSAPTPPGDTNRIQMKRSLGVWNGIAIIIGVIVGSGIFVSPKGVLLNTGSVGAALVVWALSGLLALLGALCFAELGTSIASSGGEYTYINLAYGPMASYLYIWVLVLIIMPCSNAISALTFANYCLQPLFEAPSTPPEEAIRLLALAILMLLIYINCTSLDGSIGLQNTFALAKVLALGSIICYGLYYVLAGNPFRSLTAESHVVAAAAAGAADGAATATTTPLTIDVGRGTDNAADSAGGWWSGTHASLPHLARAFYSGFFTYSGW